MRLMQIFVLIAMAVSVSFSQEKSKDTLKAVPLSVSHADPFEFNMPNFELYRSLYFTDNKIPDNVDSNSVWLWTSFSMSQQSSNSYLTSETSPHMLSTFHDMYVEKNKFNMFRTVLGAMQVGAVGYLAYKSIKENGFLTPKKKMQGKK